MPRSSSSLPSVGADTASLALLAADLRACSPAGAKAFRAGLREAGELIKEKAAQNASYSSLIPGSLKVRSTPKGNVRVSAGGSAAPDAAAIENRGAGFVRHPTFGRQSVPRARWGWTDLHSHPAFLGPAALEMSPVAAKLVADAVETAVALALRG